MVAQGPDYLKVKEPELTVSARGEFFFILKKASSLLQPKKILKNYTKPLLVLEMELSNTFPNNINQMFTVHGYRGDHFFLQPIYL